MINRLEESGPYIIAEVGINHNGNASLARLMTELSIEAGATAVKFQLFDPTELVSADAEMANYQKQNATVQESQRDMLRKNTVSLKTLEDCRDLCRVSGVDFICTAFDQPSLEHVISLEPALLKWPSGEIDNLPLLSFAASFGIPIIISTGMADQHEIQAAIETCLNVGLSREEIIVLHCTSQYPTPEALANVESVRFIRDTFGTRVGFSDHTIGNLSAQMALAVGATVFEKHVSLSRFMDGVDHKASATFDEFANYVEAIKHAGVVLGNSEKVCFEVEQETKSIARKSLFARSEIPSGTVLKREHLKAMRPGTGISPKYTEEILGKAVKKKIRAETLLSWDDFE